MVSNTNLILQPSAHSGIATAGEPVSLTLPNSQKFYCNDDAITCTGSGASILWTAPPSIMDDAPNGFISSDVVNVSRQIGDVHIVLTSVVPGSPSMCTSKLTMSTFYAITVTCQTETLGSLESLPLIQSGKFMC